MSVHHAGLAAPRACCTSINAQSDLRTPAPHVVLNGGDDTLVAREVAGATVQRAGGGGVDTVTGNATANALAGGAGNDVLSGSPAPGPSVWPRRSS